MGAWVACIGAGEPALLRGLTGGAAEVCSGEGWALGAVGGGGEPAVLEPRPDGAFRAAVGPLADAGSAALWEPAARRLTVTTDPFGLHGAWLLRRADALWCASDPRLLRRLPGVSAVMEAAALHGYLSLSHVPEPLALTPGIIALPAGSCLRVEPGREARADTAAWRETAPAPPNEGSAVETLRGLLREAVARQLGSAADVGVFLSGGLDSSLVAALLAEAGVNVRLFTLDFGPPFDLELPLARRVAEHLGLPLRAVPAGPREVGAALDDVTAALHLPFGDPVTVPLYLLGRAAAGEVEVVFNGEGGDQLFGGWANKPLVAAELYGGPGYRRETAYLETYHRLLGLEERFYTERARRLCAGVDPGAWVREALEAEGFTSLLHRLRAANLRLKGAQNIAPRAVRLAAARGLRVRSPFMDRALAEWTFSLPSNWLLNGACEKHLLKRTAEPYLPPEIVWREKRGMGVPASEWLLGPLRREAARRLGGRRLRGAGWLRPEAVRNLLRGEDCAADFRRRRRGEKLWALLMLHAWCDVQSPAVAWPTAGEGSS